MAGNNGARIMGCELQAFAPTIHAKVKTRAGILFNDLHRSKLAKRQLEINPDDFIALETLMRAYASIGDSTEFLIFRDRYLEGRGQTSGPL